MAQRIKPKDGPAPPKPTAPYLFVRNSAITDFSVHDVKEEEQSPERPRRRGTAGARPAGRSVSKDNLADKKKNKKRHGGFLPATSEPFFVRDPDASAVVRWRGVVARGSMAWVVDALLITTVVVLCSNIVRLILGCKLCSLRPKLPPP